jgi:hypothetical protein
MLEWVIIGDGIQGCTLATYLLRLKRTTMDRMLIIDPGDSPLATWKRCTSVLEMPFLRSPSVHHLDLDPLSLDKFAKTKFGKNFTPFCYPKDRPSLQLFNEHCRTIFEETQLTRSWYQGRCNGT